MAPSRGAGASGVDAYMVLIYGWCTARRFQSEGPCILGCSCSAQDSIEHYIYCPFTLHLCRKMGLRQQLGEETFLCMASGMSDNDLRVMATVVYAIYRTTNLYRNAPLPTRDRVLDAMEHYCKFACNMPGVESV